MKYYSKLLSIVILLLVLSACIREDYLGKAEQCKILAFSIQNQVGTVNIDHEAHMITLLVEESADITSLRVNTLKISSFANVYPTEGSTIDFSEPVIFTVTAENGNKSDYLVIVKRSQREIQLDNADFENWYSAGSANKSYQEPGKSATETIWATGNAGVITVGSANVAPMNDGDNTVALMKTVDLPLGRIVGQGIGAGSLFTGLFKLNASNPIASAKFGVLYSARPVSFTVRYKYSPGPIVKDGRGRTIQNAKDSCDIGIVLTNRNTEPYKQVAVAHFRSGTTVTEWTRITVNFKYGRIASPAIYELPKGIYIQENGSDRLVNCDWGTGNEQPTHISVIFSSSHRGDFFEGAPGSELYMDDVTLNY